MISIFICLTVNFVKGEKDLNLGPKVPYLGSFMLEF